MVMVQMAMELIEILVIRTRALEMALTRDPTLEILVLVHVLEMAMEMASTQTQTEFPIPGAQTTTTTESTTDSASTPTAMDALIDSASILTVTETQILLDRISIIILMDLRRLLFIPIRLFITVPLRPRQSQRFIILFRIRVGRVTRSRSMKLRKIRLNIMGSMSMNERKRRSIKSSITRSVLLGGMLGFWLSFAVLSS